MFYTGLTAKLAIKEKTGGTEEAPVYSDKTIGYISNWSVEETRDMIEITRLHSETKDIKPSLLSWTASAEGTADFAAEHNQTDLYKAMMDKSRVTLKFFLDNDTYLEGSGYIDTMSMDISAEDKGNISVSVTGDGQLTMTAPAGR